MVRFRFAMLFVAALCIAAPAQSQLRSLHWRSIVIDATLDADGRLHARERQSIVFNGDWNGGERSFTIADGQEFHFEKLSRVDGSSGAARQLRRGDLEQMDAWNFADDSTVRWRSRLPTDPPFNDSVLQYLLEYTYGGVVSEVNGQYKLSHDFAFAIRQGNIEAFQLNLVLDAAWRPPPGYTGRFSAANLAPGQSYVVELPLEYAGSGRPRALKGAAGGGAVAGMSVVGIALGLLTVTAGVGVVFWVVRRGRGELQTAKNKKGEE